MFSCNTRNSNDCLMIVRTQQFHHSALSLPKEPESQRAATIAAALRLGRARARLSLAKLPCCWQARQFASSQARRGVSEGHGQLAPTIVCAIDDGASAFTAIRLLPQTVLGGQIAARGATQLSTRVFVPRACHHLGAHFVEPFSSNSSLWAAPVCLSTSLPCQTLHWRPSRSSLALESVPPASLMGLEHGQLESGSSGCTSMQKRGLISQIRAQQREKEYR